MGVIKWLLNFVSRNFGLKSYLWFQIKLALRAHSILKSRVWFQTKLHTTQFNYHYEWFCKHAINKGVINRICLSTVNTVSVFLKFKSKKFFFGDNDSVNKLKMKFTQFFFPLEQLPIVEKTVC